MKKHIKYSIILSLFGLSLFNISCKDDNRSPRNNEDIPNYEDHPQKDTTSPEHIGTTPVDSNMQNQSDTHGRDTDAGDIGSRSGK